jgi:hypothetical protein
MENKMFNQTGGPTSRERSFLKDVEMQNFHPVASVRELRKMYPDPAPRQYAKSGITSFPRCGLALSISTWLGGK